MTVRVSNATDVVNAKEGKLDPSKVRTIDVRCFVDTGATLLCLTPELIAQLGLTRMSSQKCTTANGIVERWVWSPAHVACQDRDAFVEVMEMPPDGRPLLGYLALERMDLVVNPRKGTLEGNPDHDGKMLLDLL
ncbi:MAG: retroviral-like aspartic protease family protein [Phycisphaeraceae bacterium]